MSLDSIRETIGNGGTQRVFREHEVISILTDYLKANGWQIESSIKMHSGMVDIGATKGTQTFLIEAKGEDKGGYGSAEMNFQIGLGQVMSRMKYKDAQYGLAIPSTEHFKKVLRKYQDSFAFEKLGIYIFLVFDNRSCRIISPKEIIGFISEL